MTRSASRPSSFPESPRGADALCEVPFGEGLCFEPT